MSAPAKNAIEAQDEFTVEPVPGLPEQLPPGEHVLWSDVPDWRAVALDVFHARAVAIYAAVIIAWRLFGSLYDGAGFFGALLNTAVLAAILGLGLAILLTIAWLTAKSTRYTVTNKRVVMRIGVALTMSINLPFKQILSADYRDAPFGTGAIALQTTDTGGLGYFVLWPHVRPFRFKKPEPMLRGIKDGHAVARILATALIAANGESAPQIHIHAPSKAHPAPVAA